MKLYTEEEIISAYENAELCHLRLESFMESLTPIELPSDEEICKKNLYSSQEYNNIFRAGALWLRDKIQGGNNEQQ